MSRNRPFRQPPNMKNGVHGGVDIPKRQVQQLESGCRYGMPEWYVDVHVDSGTCGIPRTQSGLLIAGITIFTFAAFGGIGGDITAIADDHATGSHVFKDLCRDCDADTTTDVILLCDASDASSNVHLVEIGGSMVDSISQRLSLGRR